MKGYCILRLMKFKDEHEAAIEDRLIQFGLWYRRTVFTAIRGLDLRSACGR